MRERAGMILAEAPTTVGPQIARMKERHFEILRRMVAGEKPVTIYTEMGMTASWFSIVTSSPVFQSELVRLREEANSNAADIAGRIHKLAPDAMSVLENAIKGRKLPNGSCEPVDGMTSKHQTEFALEALALAGHTKPSNTVPPQVAIKVEILQFSAPATQELNTSTPGVIVNATTE
jgi:hypothetical protein